MNADDFGPRLRDLRERLGWSQMELAKRARLSPATISRLELNQCSPTLDTMLALTSAMGLPVTVLVYDAVDQADELASLIRELPTRDQTLAYALIGTMRLQHALSGGG